MRPLALAQCAILAVSSLALVGCPSVPPPVSPMPNAAAAIARMRATHAACNAVQANAKIDHFGKQGRVRGDLLMYAAVPANIRMDVISPFGVSLATLTADGTRFSLADLRDKRFYVGPATACNIARLTTVPIPGHVLVGLFRGEAPVLKHDDAATTIEWSGKGYYVVTIPSTRDASEELHLTPEPEDMGRPWGDQRMRVLEVTIRQKGGILYRAKLDDHARAPMAKERLDPDNLEPPIPPSGPECTAELPRKIHVDVPDQDEEVKFTYDQVTWNPPLPEGTFVQPVPPGMAVTHVACSD